MQEAKIESLRKEFPWYFDRSIECLPDGWFRAIYKFLNSVDDIGDLSDCVIVRFERMPYGLQAFVAPLQFNWTGDSALALLKAQEALLLASQSLCEVCGLPPVTALPGATERAPVGYFCEEHFPLAAAQIEQEKAVWADLAILFHDGPPALDPAMPDDVRKIVLDKLGKVAAKVCDDEQEGYVHIKLAFIDGVLFMRPVFVPGAALTTQIEINEICMEAEGAADTRHFIQDWSNRARAIFGSLIAEDCTIRLTPDQFYKLHRVLEDLLSMEVGFILKDCIDYNPGHCVDYDCDTTPALDSQVDCLMSDLVARLGFNDDKRPTLPESPGGLR